MRRDVRASIGRKAAHLRMPLGLSKKEEKKHLDWFEQWVKGRFNKNKNLGKQFFGKIYQHGDVLTVGKKQYNISLQLTDRKTHSGRLRNGTIYLNLAAADEPAHLQKSIRHLLSRLVAQDFLPEITRRTQELNQLHFKKNIKGVRLKYNQSNWGSCSSSGNLNFSTRLLFAPDPVIDYVIIHELSHLIEMNHSPRFWALVEQAMPDYKEKEQWLKVHGPACQF